MSMFLLVLTPNLLRILIGWDGLGLTSFLLVIFYQSKKSLNAGLLTVFTNRVGDVLIILGVCVFSVCQRWEFWVTRMSIELNPGLLLRLLILIARMTKSAQLPFSCWLPAAIAAPTPVSALVHSSTLVTAGVYLLVRFSFFLDCWLKIVISLIGVRTILMARLSALLENDLKKIIALSTLRQLGIIFCAIGTAVPEIAFYHLITHAFFKALIFISVGNLIHINSDYQDLRVTSLNYRKLPVSIIICVLANMALSGIPFLSGFISKDLILMALLDQKNSLGLIFLMYFSIFLTVLYRSRLIFLTFSVEKTKNSCYSYSENSIQFFTSMAALGTLRIFSGKLLLWFIRVSPIGTTSPELLLAASACLMMGGIAGYIKPFNLYNLRSFYKRGLFPLQYVSVNFFKNTSFLTSKLFYKTDLTWLNHIILFFLPQSQHSLVSRKKFKMVFSRMIIGLALTLFIYLYSIKVQLFAK